MNHLHTALLRTTLLTCAAIAVATPAMAQRQSTARPAPIGYGQTVSGNIGVASTGTTCTPVGPNERRYSFTAAANERIEVTMQADDFDTVVEVGKMDGCNFVSMGRNDDGGGPEDGLNSRLTGRMPEAGNYIIRATGLSSEAVGGFRLALNRLPPPAGAPTPVAIGVGQKVDGTLTSNDAMIEDTGMTGMNPFAIEAMMAATGEEPTETPQMIMDSGRPYRLYTLTGNAGDKFRIRLDSDEFDPMLEVGVDSPLGFSVAQSNDDGGGENDGLNSRLNITFAKAGTLMIRVSPLGRDTGAYSLMVVSGHEDPPELQQQDAAEAAAAGDAMEAAADAAAAAGDAAAAATEAASPPPHQH
jgi:hypothetical protein